MPGPLSTYLEEDHDRLDDLLAKATARPGHVDLILYNEFRKGLLRHIAMEEKTVWPAITKGEGNSYAGLAERLRLDHGAIAALLVPPPSESIIATLRSILSAHNAFEEQAAGFYRIFEAHCQEEADRLLEKLKGTPEVQVMPFNSNPDVLAATRRALARAGYALLSPPSTHPQ